MAARKNNAPAKAPLYREMSEIRGRFSDAKAVLETAVLVLEEGDMPPEVVTARHGLGLLESVYNELDLAVGRLSVSPVTD